MNSLTSLTSLTSSSSSPPTNIPNIPSSFGFSANTISYILSNYQPFEYDRSEEKSSYALNSNEILTPEFCEMYNIDNKISFEVCPRSVDHFRRKLIFKLYYKAKFKQKYIAELLGCSQSSVSETLQSKRTYSNKGKKIVNNNDVEIKEDNKGKSKSKSNKSKNKEKEKEKSIQNFETNKALEPSRLFELERERELEKEREKERERERERERQRELEIQREYLIQLEKEREIELEREREIERMERELAMKIEQEKERRKEREKALERIKSLVKIGEDTNIVSPLGDIKSLKRKLNENDKENDPLIKNKLVI